MMTGDAYKIPLTITVGGSESANAGTFADIEVMLGPVRKTMSAGEITFDAEGGTFLVAVTQADTMRLVPPKVRVQVRVKTMEGEVIGDDLGVIDVIKALSQEVI